MNKGEAYICLTDFAPGSPRAASVGTSQPHSFTPLLSEFAGDHWRKGSEGIYTQAWASGDGPDEAGFKIRVFVHPAFADDTLRALLPTIVEEGCPFKVIANSALLELAFSKWPPENPAGAFLTVYPPSEAAFYDLTGKLQEAGHAIKMSEAPVLAISGDGRMPLTPENPWPARDFYRGDESAYFFGFEEEQAELEKRCQRAALTVVSGAAGVGKSSLVRAGLQTVFDRAGMVPIYVHVKAGGSVHPVQQVRDEINRVLTERRIDGAPFGEGLTLRDYFYAQPQGWVDANKKPVVPILIFDQFEDVFAEAENQLSQRPLDAFWTQIGNLIENRGRDSSRQLPLPYSDARGERNPFKMIISIRQDDLSKLLAHRGKIPSITQNQFLLQPFNGRCAMHAVLGAGRRLFDPSTVDKLAEEIVRRVAGETGTSGPLDLVGDLRVDPALLSFFCQQLNEARIRSNTGGGLITAKLLETESGRIFARFFNREEPAPLIEEQPVGPPAAGETEVIAAPVEAPKVFEELPIEQQAPTEPEVVVLPVSSPELVEELPTPVVAQAVAVEENPVKPPETVETAEVKEVAATEIVQPVPERVEALAVPEAPRTVVDLVREPEPPVTPPNAPDHIETAPAVAAKINEPEALVSLVEVAEPPPAEEPRKPVEKTPDAPQPVHFSEAPLRADNGEGKIRRLRYMMGAWGVLLVIILTILVVTRIEDLQRDQTQAELEEFISHLASARNTFNSAHRELSIAEANLALKESNLLALTAQAREQQREARAAQEQNSKLAGEKTNFQSRINDLADEKNKAETRVAQWSSLLNDLTNQIANLTRQKEELEARNRRLSLTNQNPVQAKETRAVTNTPPNSFSLTLSRPSASHEADEKQATAMESPAEKLAAPVITDTEPSTRRTGDILLIHGQCLYAENGTTFQPLLLRQNVHQGAVIKTGKISWCDLFIRRAGITIRLAPESAVKIAKLSLGSQNGIPVVDTALELPYGRIFTVVRALVPGSTLEISDGAGRSVIEGGGLGSYMITAPRPDFSERLSVVPLRIVSQNGSTVLTPNQEYNAKDGTTFSLGASTWETTLLHLDELEAEADKALAQPEGQAPAKGSSQ